MLSILTVTEIKNKQTNSNSQSKNQRSNSENLFLGDFLRPRAPNV